MNKKMLKNTEWGILICSLILLGIGIVALFSATNESVNEEYRKQIMWAIVSVPIMIFVMLIDYNSIAKASPVFYGITIIALVAVLFTDPINGATSWFKISETFTIQPSEFSKIILIIFLSYILVKLQEKGRMEINKIWKLLVIGLIAGVPIGLIVIQPDYGTVMAFVTATALMLFAAGIDKKYIILVALLVIIGVPLLYKYVLPAHAKTRIDVFLNQESDQRGAGYNLRQSKIAIRFREAYGNGNFKRKSNTAWLSLS